jgi:hypothetical protein
MKQEWFCVASQMKGTSIERQVIKRVKRKSSKKFEKLSNYFSKNRAVLIIIFKK